MDVEIDQISIQNEVSFKQQVDFSQLNPLNYGFRLL